MTPTVAQEDALRELFNIGYGRAAAALSEMTQARVLLEAPELSLLELAALEATLAARFKDGLTCVNQAFSGPFNGNALLLLDKSSASTLRILVLPPESSSDDADHNDVIMEIGNILLNSCLGVFGNLLRVQVGFTLPNMTVGSVTSLLRSLRIQEEPLSHAILVHTRFTIRASNVKGYLGIVLGAASTRDLLAAVDDWMGGGP